MTIHLYIATHNVTGLKYFGKTVKKSKYYKGSGKYWIRHLRKHGSDVTMEYIAEFSNADEASALAINFSLENDIVNSPLWANFNIENALDGAPQGHVGHKFTDDQLRKISESSKKKWSEPDYRARLKSVHKERLQNEEARLKCGNAFRGKTRPEHSLKLKGRTLSEEAKEKLRKPKHPGHGAKVSAALTGLKKSDAHRAALSEARKNAPLKTCPHCGVTMNSSSYGRYHGDRCKLNLSVSKDSDLPPL